MADDPEVEALNERLFRVQASHEQAVRLRNWMAEYLGEVGIITNRHPGSDEQHIEISQEAAARILDALDALGTIDEALSDLHVRGR